MQDNEPSLEKMDDYNGKESPQKRKIINSVIIFCLVMGAILVTTKIYNQDEQDYVGTKDKPGIQIIRHF
ncbi:MAG TPA: hypothetical protein EYG73_06885 [Arcobacter sp.]|nr:hypothetical protein [Arcobacter sp.]